MKIHQNFLTYVRQLKENPLEKIEDFPSIQLIEASDFDIAIGLCEKYAHKRNRFILPTLQVSKERFLSGGEPRYFRRQEPITSVNKLRMYLHSTLHKYWREEKWKEISHAIDSAFPSDLHKPFYKLEKLVKTLSAPSKVNSDLNKKLDEANEVDMSEVEELINQCEQIQNPVLLQEKN